jgi:hypothetical protein
MFMILYVYNKIKAQDLEVTNKDFYESLESCFQGKSTATTYASFDLSTASTLSAMREPGKTNPNILIGTLKSFY